MKRIYIPAIAMLCCSAATAQEVLDLAACRALALQYNKEISAAAKQTEAADYTAKSYKANALPSISLRATGLYSTAEGEFGLEGGMLPVGAMNPQLGQWVPDGTTAFFPGVNLEYEVGPVVNAAVSVEQPIYMGGKINAANKMARIGHEIAEANENLTRQNVILATEKAYVTLVRAKELKKVADKYHELLTQLMSNVEKAYKQGYKPQNDVLKVQVKLNEAELQVRRANNGIRLATMNLCHYIGRDLTDNIDIAEGFPEMGEPFNYQADITQRPEYSMLDRQAAIAEEKVRLQRAEQLPQVGLMASYGYLNGVEVNGDKLFDSGSLSVMLNVSVPLYHFGQNHNKTKAARAQREQTLIERDRKNELMTLELTQAINNYDESLMQSTLAEKSLEQAEENLRISGKQYEVGTETLSDHLEAQVLWQKAYQTHVDARFEQYIAHMAVLRATGCLDAPR